MTDRNKGYGAPGSILETATPAMLAKIKRAKARYAAETHALEAWARGGFTGWTLDAQPEANPNWLEFDDPEEGDSE